MVDDDIHGPNAMLQFDQLKGDFSNPSMGTLLAFILYGRKPQT